LGFTGGETDAPAPSPGWPLSVSPTSARRGGVHGAATGVLGCAPVLAPGSATAHALVIVACVSAGLRLPVRSSAIAVKLYCRSARGLTRSCTETSQGEMLPALSAPAGAAYTSRPAARSRASAPTARGPE